MTRKKINVNAVKRAGAKVIRRTQSIAESHRKRLDVAAEKRKESALVDSIMKSDPSTMGADSSMTVEDRLAKRMWLWLTDTTLRADSSWASQWIEKNRAKTVGMQNVSNREKWLEATLKKVPKGSKILDAGAGELQYKRFCKHLNYVSQDFGQYTGEGDIGLQQGTWDNSKLDIISDITDIPVEANSFDVIMCIEVFEHIPKPIDAIREFSRILKPGGQLIIAAPFASFTHFAPYYFYNGYSRYFYETILPEHDFEVKEVYGNGNFFEVVAQEIRRVDDMAVRYAPGVRKPTALDNLVREWLLRRLEKLSQKDTGSDEFAVHDMGVVAIKKSVASTKSI